MSNSECVFCGIADHSVPTTFVHEDAEVMAFYDIRPEAPTHILIVPKRHIEKLTDLHDQDANLVSQLFLRASEIARSLGVDDACKFAINNGKGAGQIVPHLHIHLLSQKRPKNQ